MGGWIGWIRLMAGLGEFFGGRLDLMEFLEEGKISLRLGLMEFWWKAGWV